MSQGFYGFPRILDVVRATSFKALGKIGATNGAALAGGTASGAPTAPAGPFDVGDVIVDASGKLWICTTAGTSPSSPGSFTQVGGTTSPLSTKGDVWVYGSADARLGVGSDSQVLTADSTQSLGLKWATGSSSTLAGDTDASISSPAAGQLLEYDGAHWVNYTVPAVRAYNNANQSVANSTVQAITLNSTRFDQGASAQHSTSVNTSRLTCQQAGVYQITGLLRFAQANSTGTRIALLRLNGTTEIGRSSPAQANDASNNVHACTTALYQLAAADYVELCAFQNSGGGLNVEVQANYSPEFMWVRVA